MLQMTVFYDNVVVESVIGPWQPLKSQQIFVGVSRYPVLIETLSLGVSPQIYTYICTYI